MESLGRQWHECVGQRSSTSQREVTSPLQSGSRRGNGEEHRKVVVELLLELSWLWKRLPWLRGLLVGLGGSWLGGTLAPCALHRSPLPSSPTPNSLHEKKFCILPKDISSAEGREERERGRMVCGGEGKRGRAVPLPIDDPVGLPGEIMLLRDASVAV
jgi:hypothetical protein